MVVTLNIEKYLSLLPLSFEALKERKLRSTLTILMVIVGSGLLVAVDGISTGTLSYIDQQFANLGANLIMMTPRGTDFEIDDNIVKEVSRIEGVTDTIPFIQSVVRIESRRESQSVVAVGVDHSKLHLIFPTLKLKEGNLVSYTDSVGIVLGNLVAYGSGGEPFATVGQTVKLRYSTTIEGEQVVFEKSFIVRGVLEYIGSGIIPVDQMVFISLPAANSFFDRHNKYDGIYVITADPSLNDEIMDQLQDMYNVNVISPQTIIEVINRVSNAISFFVGNIATVSLLVASIGIITTLWTSVLERIREIGVLKSIGFQENDILVLFLNEAAIIGVIGGTLGLIFGVILARILMIIISPEFANVIQPIFTVESLVSTWLLSLGLSIIAGLYPAWRASKLDPVAALRHE